MLERRIRVAICGGGIGGLALAAIISRYSDDVPVDVFEAKQEISELGAAIYIWKRSWLILKDIGLEDEFAKRNIPPPREEEVRGPLFRKSDQRHDGYDFHAHMMPYGPVSLPRSVLLEILEAKISKNCTIHTSKRLTSYNVESTGSVTLRFADGSMAHADVLVGADGIRSSTRKIMFSNLGENADPSKAALYKECIEPKWTGTLAYRCFVQLDKFKEKYPQHQAMFQAKIWCGKNKHIISNPFGGKLGVTCYYAVENGEGTHFQGPWVEDVPKQEVIDCYEGWEPDLLSMLEYVVKPSRWAIHVVNHLPLSVSGPVALLGDSAHAMTTDQGVGGCQAIEDAHILGRLLAHKDIHLDNIADVLRIYQDIRLPLSQAASDKSRENGLMYKFNHSDYWLTPDASKAQLEELGNAIGESFKWLGQGGCDEDWSRAEELLRKTTSGAKV